MLEQFNGSGTTGVVANKLERNYIGIELSDEQLSAVSGGFCSTDAQNCKKKCSNCGTFVTIVVIGYKY